MEIKLIRSPTRETFLLLIRGSRNVVKKHDVAIQTTPTETLEAWILAKKAVQWTESIAPQSAIGIILLKGTL